MYVSMVTMGMPVHFPEAVTYTQSVVAAKSILTHLFKIGYIECCHCCCAVKHLISFLGLIESFNINDRLKISKELSEQGEPFVHKVKDVSNKSHQKVHPNFQNVKILGKTNSWEYLV